MALLTSDNFTVAVDTLIEDRVPTVGTGWTLDIAGTPLLHAGGDGCRQNPVGQQRPRCRCGLYLPA